ncbi:MAG: hypothetical protein Q6K99_09955 [Thermostichales cyanobacterium BF4_bins_65]
MAKQAKKTPEGLSYRQAQKRNSDIFRSLAGQDQKLLRQQGYKNSGWEYVQRSWGLLQAYLSTPVVELADYAVKKAEMAYQQAKDSGDLVAVLEAGQALIDSLKLKYR